MSERAVKIIITVCLIGAFVSGCLAWKCHQSVLFYEELREIIVADSTE